MSDDAGDTKFECYCVVLPPDGVAVKIKELAGFLGYENVKHAYALIPNEWKIKWKDLELKLVRKPDQLVTSSNQTQLPANWHPETLFVLEPGVYALMARSNKPMAKQRMKFVYETSETYTAEQVVHTMNHCQNYFVKNVFNINFVTPNAITKE